MEIIISGEPKEIADLVLAVQGQPFNIQFTGGLSELGSKISGHLQRRCDDLVKENS